VLPRLGSFCILGAGLLLAQAPAAPESVLNPNLPAHPIGPNDLLSVSVYDSPELTRTVRVGAGGEIRLPMLKQKVQAAGHMPSELEAALAKALADEQLVVDPFVTITVVEYHSRPVSVAGAVKMPLTFQATGPVTLLEALTKAGGLTADAGSEILVSRTQAGTTALVRRIPVKGLIDQADPELNLPLEGGEEIRVPEIGKVFIMGNVKKPGAYPVQRGEETSVLKLLALAEGLTAFSCKVAFIYRHTDSGAQKQEIPLELDKIMKRKIPDQQLYATDVLYIPDATGRRVSMMALERILAFGSTAGATALVYGAR
jgi:polysaccharide biosynthesis/export protein